MNILLFGATGMVGQGVLRECLRGPGVECVTAIGRSATGQTDPKLREIVHRDLLDFSSIETQLAGFDACFFCLGVSSVGMKEKDYERITYGITLAAAETLCRLNPRMTFVYVSGLGTDSSEKGGSMWARVNSPWQKSRGSRSTRICLESKARGGSGCRPSTTTSNAVYAGKSWLPFGFGRRAAICFVVAAC